MTTRPKGSEDIDRPLLAAGDIAVPGWAGVDAAVATSSLWEAVRALPRAIVCIVRLGWRVSPPMVILVGLLDVLSGVVTATGLLATVNVFTAVLEQGPTPQRVISALPSLAVVALAYAGRAILQTAVSILEGTLRPRIAQVADYEAAAGLTRSTLLAFEDADFRELAAQGGRGGVHAIETSVGHIASLISSVTAISVALATVGLLNPWLPAVLLLPVLVDGWTAARIARLNYQNFLDTVTHNMRKAVIAEAVTDRDFALERHALTLQDRLLAEYRAVSEQLTCEKAGLARRSALARASGRFAAGMATLLAYAALAALLYFRVMPLALAGTTVVAMQTAATALTTGMHELNALYENSFRMGFYH
jgi:ATP-binding cassette, subfamily B, bacterial